MDLQHEPVTIDVKMGELAWDVTRKESSRDEYTGRMSFVPRALQSYLNEGAASEYWQKQNPASVAEKNETNLQALTDAMFDYAAGEGQWWGNNNLSPQEQKVSFNGPFRKAKKLNKEGKPYPSKLHFNLRWMDEREIDVLKRKKKEGDSDAASKLNWRAQNRCKIMAMVRTPGPDAEQPWTTFEVGPSFLQRGVVVLHGRFILDRVYIGPEKIYVSMRVLEMVVMPRFDQCLQGSYTTALTDMPNVSSAVLSRPVERTSKKRKLSHDGDTSLAAPATVNDTEAGAQSENKIDFQ